MPLPPDALASAWTRTARWEMHALTSAAPPKQPENEPPVVLVHGQIVSSRYMEPLAHALAPHHRVLAPDLPGYGKSEKPPRALTPAELADALDGWMGAEHIATARVIGTSYGCQIAAEFAVRHPARVERLVLHAPTTDPAARNAPAIALRWVRDTPRETPRLLGVIVRDTRDAGFVRGVGTLLHLLADRIEDKLPHIQAPTLVVRGADDVVVPQSWAERVVELLPRGELLVLPDSGHAANFTHADDLARALLPFLRGS